MTSTEMRVAAIDLGTVSSRLALATLRDGRVANVQKHTVITDLGEGVDANARFSEGGVRRVLDACTDFCARIREFGPRAVSTTLTSAARDASNAAVLLDGLRGLGLAPQVIPGEVEAKLTFFGVAHDFPGQRIAVADSGGGSTELVVGSYTPGEPLALDAVRSLDIGCRRVTERFLGSMPPARADLDRAAAFARSTFAPYWEGLEERPDRLVAVGGTVTTLVALANRLEPYDSSFVHLHDLSLSEVEDAIEHMKGLDAEGIAALPGVQAKRAPVMLGGAVIIGELLRAGGFTHLTVSENSLLAGMAATLGEVLRGEEPTIGWRPEVSR